MRCAGQGPGFLHLDFKPLHGCVEEVVSDGLGQRFDEPEPAFPGDCFYSCGKFRVVRGLIDVVTGSGVGEIKFKREADQQLLAADPFERVDADHALHGQVADEQCAHIRRQGQVDL